MNGYYARTTQANPRLIYGEDWLSMSHTLTSYIGDRLRWKQGWQSVSQYLQCYYTTQPVKWQCLVRQVTRSSLLLPVFSALRMRPRNVPGAFRAYFDLDLDVAVETGVGEGVGVEVGIGGVAVGVG
ncbi:MAG: hypothetical protein OEW09_12495 [Anaerolineae bacterium]|nr:hypothetical protein [Anaerolineae bacterium]